MSSVDLDLVRHALTVARQRGFAEVEIGVGEQTFSAQLDPLRRKPTASKSASTELPAEPEFLSINATLVGYYREAKTPLTVGSSVQKGDVVAVIAALGIANDVESKVSGEIVEVLVEPNQPVEYGQPLAKVKP